MTDKVKLWFKGIGAMLMISLAVGVVLKLSSQSGEIDRLTIVAAQAQGKVTELQEENTKLKGSNQVTQSVEKLIDDLRQKDFQDTTGIKDEILKKIRDLDARYPATDKITELESKRKMQEENKIRANGLWRIFCIRNPEFEECAKNIK